MQENQINKKKMSFEDWYALAVNYFNKNKSLEVPLSFKTSDGMNYDKDGYNLGLWISNMRKYYRGNGVHTISHKQVAALSLLGMRWENDSNKTFEYLLEIATNYYNHYGNLDVPKNFNTIDGITYEEEGYSLDRWLINMRRSYLGEGIRKISDKQVEALTNIGMKWDATGLMQFEDFLLLLENYKSVKGNIDVPLSFKTKDGIHYDEQGYSLGHWVRNMRRARKGKGRHEITEQQIDALTKLGMRWNIKSNYNKAKNNFNNVSGFNDLKKTTEVKNVTR